MNPYDKAYELARAIRESKEVKKFKELKAKVEADESAKKMYEDFMQKQIKVQAQQMMGTEVSEEELEQIRKNYEIISMHANVSALLNAEQQLSVLLGDIQNIIADAIADE